MISAALVFQFFVAICPSGTDADSCHRGSSAVITTAAGPLASNQVECLRDGEKWFADYANQYKLQLGDKVMVFRCAEVGEGKPPTAEYGKVGEPEAHEFTPDGQPIPDGTDK